MHRGCAACADSATSLLLSDERGRFGLLLAAAQALHWW